MKSILERYYLKRVIRNHVNTFNSYGTNSTDYWAVAFHFIFPLILSFLAITFFKESIIKEIDLITVNSIFIGLLFNLFILIFGISPESKKESEKAIIKNLSHNIIFAIYISILSVIFLLALKVKIDFSYPICDYAVNIIPLFVYYLLFLFILNLFLILRRFIVLMEPEKVI